MSCPSPPGGGAVLNLTEDAASWQLGGGWGEPCPALGVDAWIAPDICLGLELHPFPCPC